MKILWLFVFAVSCPAFAGQNWWCEGTARDGDPVLVIFETKENTVIANALVTKTQMVLSRKNAETRRDNPVSSKEYNRFDLTQEKGSPLGLLLPVELAKQIDEFPAFLQMGTIKPLIKADLKCTGAGDLES